MNETNTPRAIVVERDAFRPTLTLAAVADARTWFDRENELWDWTRKDEGIPGGGPAEAIQRYRNWPQSIRDQVDRWEREPQSEEARRELEAAIRGRLVDGHQTYLCSLDIAALAIAELAKTSRVAAAAALGHVHGVRFNENLMINNALVRVGRAHGAVYQAGVGHEVLEALRAMMASTREQLDERLREFAKTLGSINKRANESITKIESDAAAAERKQREEFDSSEATRQEQFDILVRSLDDTRQTYESVMELLGPVRYWGNKARSHRRSTTVLGVLLGIYTVVSIAFFVWLFQHTAELLPADAEKIPVAALFRASAFAALMITIIFWIGRILVRMFLSDRHLATDAEERRTMIMTFLALTKRKAVDEKDRTLILAAIFRAGSDGIVKDETGPDTAAATLIGAILKR